MRQRYARHSGNHTRWATLNLYCFKVGRSTLIRKYLSIQKVIKYSLQSSTVHSVLYVQGPEHHNLASMFNVILSMATVRYSTVDYCRLLSSYCVYCTGDLFGLYCKLQYCSLFAGWTVHYYRLIGVWCVQEKCLCAKMTPPVQYSSTEVHYYNPQTSKARAGTNI